MTQREAYLTGFMMKLAEGLRTKQAFVLPQKQYATDYYDHQGQPVSKLRQALSKDPSWKAVQRPTGMKWTSPQKGGPPMPPKQPGQ